MEQRQETRVLAKVVVADEATEEALAAIARILRAAGLIVEAKGRELSILVEDTVR